MNFIILPVEDAQLVFNSDELSTLRHNIAGTQVIVHEEILIDKRNQLGLSTLPTDNNGNIEWTYPVYKYETAALNDLLSSDDWTDNTEINLQ